MNTEIKARWIEALRSNRYQQGATALRRVIDGKDAFCCLGVLCDLVAPDEWHKIKEINLLIGAPAVFAHANATGIPSHDFCDRVKLSDTEACELASLNDGGMPFSVIADWIENNILDMATSQS